MQIDSFVQTITVPGGVSSGPPLDVDLKIYYMTPTQPEKPKDPEKPEDSEDKGKDDKGEEDERDVVAAIMRPLFDHEEVAAAARAEKKAAAAALAANLTAEAGAQKQKKAVKDVSAVAHIMG